MLIETGTQPDTSAQAEESARIEQAKAELIDEQQGQGPQDDGEQPLILGKYKTYEELEKAYTSLQQEFSRIKNGQAPTVSDQTKAADQAGNEKADSTGPDSGVSEEIAQATIEALLDQAGGQDGYQRLTRWASAYLDPSRIDAYNQALQGGNKDAALVALKAIQYDMMQSEGYQPSLVSGKAPSVNSVKAFESEQQVVAAMSDPRYSGMNPDPAYIREVERRLAASDTVFATR